MKKTIIFTVTLLLLFSFTITAKEKSYTVDNVNVSITLTDHGNAKIREIWMYIYNGEPVTKASKTGIAVIVYLSMKSRRV